MQAEESTSGRSDEIRTGRISELLHLHAVDQIHNRPEVAVWTPDPAAQEFILDLDRNPHAYLIGCLAQRSSPAERAWELPYKLKGRLGSLDVQFLTEVGEERLTEEIETSPALHRFPQAMAKNIRAAAERIVDCYEGDAAAIWNGNPSVATVTRRFLEFDGIGPKIATMSTNLLVSFFRVPMRDLHFLDLPVDVQIRRVFQRLGLVREKDDDEVIVARARELWPEFPGMVDVALWEVGRELCRPQAPRCFACFLVTECPSARRA